MKQTENLIFLHIPKNGGMTLHSILERIYLPKNTFSIKVINNTRLNTEDFLNLPQKERENIKLLKGHMLYGLHQHLCGPSRYITFLRKPEDRLLSFYHYVQKRPQHRLYEEIFGKGLSFHQFIEQMDAGDIHNAQVRWISGIAHGTDEEMLETALKNIKKHFSFVGILEQYDVSLLMLSKIYGWGIPYYKSQNKGKYKVTKIDPDTLQLIREYNNGDKLLYNEIEKRFNSQKKTIHLLPYKKYQLKLANKICSSHKINQIKKLF